MPYVAAFRFKDHEYYTELSETLSFGTHKKDKINVPGSTDHILTLSPTGDNVNISVQPPLRCRSNTAPVNELMVLDSGTGSVLYVSRISGMGSVGLELPYNGIIHCGRRAGNDIVLTVPIVSGEHFIISCENGQVHIEDCNSTNHLYLNGRLITKAVMRNGDVLSIYTFRFHLKNGVMYFENMGSALKISDSLKTSSASPETVAPTHTVTADTGAPRAAYLNYHRSPRTREQMPQETIILSAAPGQGPAGSGRRGNAAYLIGSGAMMAASLATGMLSPGMLLARMAGMISPVVNMASYSKMSREEKQQLEEYERLRQETYQAYIADQKARIKKIADVQKRITETENQSPASCMETVLDLRRSLWERMVTDSDFLVTRLGKGKVPLCVEVKSRVDADGYKMNDDDELEQLSNKIIEETRFVDDMPVCISLKNNMTVGIVGPRERTYYLLRSMIIELTTQHSFRDVHIVGLFDCDARGRWGVLRWLPHIWDDTNQVRYIAFDAETRHVVCEMIADIIRRRSQAAQEVTAGAPKLVTPHYIIIAQSRDILLSEGIYDELVANDPRLGMTLIVLSDSMYDLPQTCQLIIDMTDRPHVYEREKYNDRIYFTQDEQVHQSEMEHFSRHMSAIELEMRSRSASIPSAVTFLQGYGVRTPEELNILRRWEESRPHLTLAAPIGVMEGGKLFCLDVKDGDQAHGPHGLLAGTTGSGKSELLQTWILSMAVSYHPHDVNFVIIDYKGGGMSDLMEPLPHVVGKITNIDKNIGRSLVSLKSELRRRQELFAAAGVNNIGKYQKAYRNGEVAERLPHLIIVTDEFAEMKKEEPEFMTELNSVAAIGRSLGIHMLLATQKPAGVVTDQINSNSRFRICMKVQDVADSREMIKRSDAAKITQAGRAYVRVGEDEIFELFQSFYSAAEYNGMSSGMVHENQVRVVGVTGNRINLEKKESATAAALTS